jgi:glycine/D-amino acid oxidase-like deaminating enzyme
MSELHAYDVVIIGSGAAGLTAAINLAERFRVVVIAKGALSDGSTAHAQGGIAAVLEPGDTFESHIEDTMIAGAGLNNRHAVEFVIGNAPGAPRGEDGGAAGEQLDPPGAAVDGIDAPDVAIARIMDAVPAGDEVDRHHVGDEVDIGVGVGRAFERLLHRPAGRVIDVDDTAVAVAAFAREVPALRFAGVEGDA